MKRSFYLIFALLLMVGVASCSDDNIGSSLTDTKSSVIMDSSFVITGQSVRNDGVHARTSTQLVGKLKSDGYGTLSSDVVCQLMPGNTIDTAGVKSDWIDSCRLTLCINYNSGFTGDSLAPMRISVYPLIKQLPEPIYSNFDPTGYYDKNSCLGSVACSPKSAEVDYYYNSSTYTTTYWREVHVPFPVSYAKSMWDLYHTDREAFSDPEKFKQYYPGLYITTSYGSGRVMNYYTTELEVFYRQHYQLTDTTDTIYNSQQSYVASTPEVINNNIIHLDADQKVKNMVDNGDAIVMGPAGYEVNIKFPIQEIIDNYKKNTSDGLARVNTMTLYIPVEEISNTYDIDPPEYLLITKKSKKDDFFAGDSLVNNEDSFYATYDESAKQYVFSGMREFVLNIINNQNGIATDEDKNLVITPIDVTTYTNTSSSSYYYYYYSSSTSSTTVTKIAPSVSEPSIAKLKLDKAKIRIVYSKQSVY